MDAGRTVVAEVETAIDPDAVVVNWDVFLWVDWPFSWLEDVLQDVRLGEYRAVHGHTSCVAIVND